MSTNANSVTSLGEWLAANPEPSVPSANYTTLAERTAYMKAKASHDRWIETRDSIIYAGEISAAKESAQKQADEHNRNLEDARARFNGAASTFVKSLHDDVSTLLSTRATVDEFGEVSVAPKDSRSSSKFKLPDGRLMVVSVKIVPANSKDESDE